MSIQSLIDKLNTQADIEVTDSQACLDALLHGDGSSEDEIVDLLRAINSHGYTPKLCIGFLQAMRACATPITLSRRGVMDVCGTGGSGKSRFNTSTALAILLASMGVPVAKHGNVGSKAANGSFNFIEALGIPYPDMSVENWESLFAKHGLCFLFAKQFHPAMKAVGPARIKLGERSIFNCLGPLANPATLDYQLIGVSDPALLSVLADVASQALGLKQAIIVLGHNGLDDLSNTGPSECIGIRDGKQERFTIDPESIGCPIVEPSAIEGGAAVENAELFRDLIAKRDTKHPIMQLLALNAALALQCAQKAKTLSDGFQDAISHIQSGELGRFLDAYIHDSQSLL